MLLNHIFCSVLYRLYRKLKEWLPAFLLPGTLPWLPNSSPRSPTCTPHTRIWPCPTACAPTSRGLGRSPWNSKKPQRISSTPPTPSCMKCRILKRTERLDCKQCQNFFNLSLEWAFINTCTIFYQKLYFMVINLFILLQSVKLFSVFKYVLWLEKSFSAYLGKLQMLNQFFYQKKLSWFHVK